MGHYCPFGRYGHVSPVYEAIMAVKGNNGPFILFNNAITGNIDPA